MRKTLLLLSTLLCMSFSTILFGNDIVIKEASALTSPDWIQCDTHGKEDVTGDATDYIINGLSSYGTRVRTAAKYSIDGLTFDYDVHHLSAEPNGEKFNINGFYFSNNTDAYVAPGDHSNNEAIYSLTSKLAYSDNQDRFGIFAHHNIFEPGANLANVKCYYDKEKTNKGFGYSDGTMIMSHHADDIGGLRFKFKKINENTFKVTITELYSNSMWVDKSFNYNYEGGKTFVYVDANSFDMDSDGKSYLFCYGFKTDDASSACIPEIHFKNIKVVTGCTVTFNTNGATPINPAIVKEGELVDEPEDPILEGNEFLGWFEDSALINLFDFDTPIYEDLTLYAGWSLLMFTVTFDTKGLVKINDKTIAYGKLVTKPKITFPSDIIFEGWFTSEDYSTEFDFANTVITADTTIYGKVTKILPDKTPLIVIVSVVSVVAVAGLSALIGYLVIHTKKKKIALEKIDEIRKEFKEKNKDED